ncbi:MAG TPA: glycosyltransferase [Candidatus Methylacidiphilales bacterium]|nr:glycosyltransferase [Candidatus Methylacidiphilales bacterium]
MRWLLVSWGSHGDLHPFLALGRALMERGHQVTLVGHPDWGVETATAGIRFVSTGEPLRETFVRDHPEVMSPKWGGLVSLHTLIHRAIAPGFDHVLEALLPEAYAHDVMVAHHFVFPAPAVAELANIPLATVSLAPGVIPSAWSLPGANFWRAGNGAVARLRNRFIWSAGKAVIRTVVDPAVNRFRARHGLAPVRDAVFCAHPSVLNLQLYSEHFASRPPDWPALIRYAGFCFYNPPGVAALPPEAEEFLSRGEPPILVTLGSTVVQNPGAFFFAAAEALKALGLRGIFLTGPMENRPVCPFGDSLTLSYAPYGFLMPRVGAVVHQCGIGTLSHTLRAGVPSVACPFAFDQPNNARRLESLGVAEVVLPHQHTATHIQRALCRLQSGDAAVRVRRLGELIRAEDGPGRACEILEKTFRRGA